MSLDIDEIMRVFDDINKPRIPDFIREDIDNRFTYHAPIDDQAEKYESIRSKLKTMAYFICAICPPSRERSIAITRLEDAMFWANASIARD